MEAIVSVRNFNDMEDVIANFKIWFTDIRWSAVISHAVGILIGFLGGVFWKNKSLQKDRDEWKAMANSQLKISRQFKRKYVTAVGQVDQMIKESRSAHTRTQEFRAENNYLYAMMMREGLFKPEDHEHMNQQRLDNISELFKNMHK